jgi:hypothetical protein
VREPRGLKGLQGPVEVHFSPVIIENYFETAVGMGTGWKAWEEELQEQGVPGARFQ